MREWLEYAVAWTGLKLLGLLPRPAARWVGASFASVAYAFRGPLRRAAMFNLHLAFPEWSEAKRKSIIRGMIRQIGWMAGEFSQFPRYTPQNIGRVVVIDGAENFDFGQRRGKGVLFLTGHLGAWELSAFAHSLQGHPLSIVMRSLDNPYIDAFLQSYRTMHGNRTVDKDDFVRGLLSAMRAGETVGILMDTNMTPPQGVFVDFFGIPACTASGLARIALRTDAAVVPGFTVWDSKLRKYILRFDPAVELIRTGDNADANEADIVANTAKFTRVIEDFIRRYPDQWLWVHRRWKTRPPGQPPLY